MTATLEARVQFLGDVPNPNSPIAGLWMQGAYNLLHDAMREREEFREMEIERTRELQEAVAEIEALRNAPLKSGGVSVTDEMVSRFLAWRLPADFGPDAGISFKPYREDMTPDSHLWPVGTNLLTAVQARAMLEHVLATPAPYTCAACGKRFVWVNKIPDPRCSCGGQITKSVPERRG